MNDDDEPRERPCHSAPVPAGLKEALAGRAWFRDLAGESGCAIYRLETPGGGADLYLKHGRGTFARDAGDELARLQWLAGRVPVPALHHAVVLPEETWLVTEALAGTTAWQALSDGRVDPLAICDALAAFLRQLHAIPPEHCPFAADHARRLAAARERLEAGLVDEDDFDPEREGWSARTVWEEMVALLPFATEPVVTHGDASLDNLVLAPGGGVGCLDVGRLGVADRYQDLAIAWNGLGDFDAALQRRFLASYGIEAPDERRLRFHLMLDEFF